MSNSTPQWIKTYESVLESFKMEFTSEELQGRITGVQTVSGTTNAEVRREPKDTDRTN